MNPTRRYDLSEESDRYYRTRLRLGRWPCGGVFLGLAALLVDRVAVQPPDPVLIPVYVAAAALEGLLFVLAFVYAVPTPTSVVVSVGVVTFWTGDRKPLPVSFSQLPFRFRMLERVAAPTGVRTETVFDPGLFAVVGLRRIPLNRSAYDAIANELARAGVVPTVRRDSSLSFGDWKVSDYRTGTSQIKSPGIRIQH